MIDTIAAYIHLERDLSLGGFNGRSKNEDMGTGVVTARLWANQQGDVYEPRVTYWPADGVLKVEFSVPKMARRGANVVVTAPRVWNTLLEVDEYLALRFGELPPLLNWTCIRVDYYYHFDVGDDLSAYLEVLADQSYPQAVFSQFRSGVQFKTQRRIVKFYDKHAESGGQQGVLRYEVSNLNAAVKYMCDEWWECDRTVLEVIRESRAHDCLSRTWQRLGMDVANYTSEGIEAGAVRDAFGKQSTTALGALRLVRMGMAAYKQGLMSRASYYRWRARLRGAGVMHEGVADLPALIIEGNYE